MADLELTLDGVDDLERKLAKVDMLEVLRPAMYRAVLRLQSAMAKYPPPPPRSKYRRSGTLGRRWTHKVDINDETIEGRVGNTTLYGPYVQSEKFQAHWMRHWTNTDQRVINEERSAIISDFQQVINRALDDL